MKNYTSSDIELSLIRDQKVAIIGYGNQGAAHAQNLRDSGVDVIVGARIDSATGFKAEKDKFIVLPVREAAYAADVIMIMAPDEMHQEIYETEIAPEMTAGKTLGFCHGFSVHFGFIKAPAHTDVIMISPKVPGYVLRENYLSSQGSLCLAATAQNPSGRAFNLALSYAAAISGGDAGILESTFGDECETNLFGEQAVLCGGIPEIIKAGYDTLVEAGYPEELAYSECLNQTKLLVDLIVAGGIKYMREKISNTAEYGGIVSGSRIVDDHARQKMREVLADVRSGQFAQEWMNEHKNGNPNFQKLRDAEARHGSEAIGAEMRFMMHGTKTVKRKAG